MAKFESISFDAMNKKQNWVPADLREHSNGSGVEKIDQWYKDYRNKTTHILKVELW